MSIVSFIFATIKKSDYMSPDSEYTEVTIYNLTV